MLLFPYAVIYYQVIHFIHLTVTNNWEHQLLSNKKSLMIIAKVNNRIPIILAKICLLMTLIQTLKKSFKCYFSAFQGYNSAP